MIRKCSFYTRMHNSTCSTFTCSILCELPLMHYYSNTKMCVKQTFIPYFISSHQQLNTLRVLTSKKIIPPKLQQRTPFLFECTCKMDLHYLFESKQSRISTS